MNYWEIIDRHIENPWTKKIYIAHVSLVTNKAIKIAKQQNLSAYSIRFIEEAGMLHDIGIVRVKDPEIGCNGKLPYVCHGVEGRKILESEGLPRHALVAERHTGVGITLQQIEENNLPLPKRDMLAETLEEKIISWTDLFFSKSPSKLLYEKSIEEVFDSIKDFGEGSIQRFNDWKNMFQE